MLAVPKSESLSVSAKKVNEKLENVFPDERVENMFAYFESKAKDGFVSKEDFPAVLTSLFEDTKHEQVAFLLENEYFMERTFCFLDQGAKGKLSAEDFERVSIMFSADSDDLISFRFFVYDVGQKGYIVKQDMFKMIHSCFVTALKVKERELKELVDAKQAEPEDLVAFAKAREQLLGEKNVADEKIQQAVAWAFETTVREKPEQISEQEFREANRKNDEFFDWRSLVEDLTDLADDLQRLL